MWNRLKNLKESILNYSLPSPKTGSDKKIKVNGLGQYLYILTTNGLTLRHWAYTINQTDDDLLEWGENNL